MHLNGMKNDLKVLLVDDEIDVLEFISYCLNREGYHTSVAKNGNEAVQFAMRDQPDLVLLDISMQGMDGYAVARKIRSLKEIKQTLIVFLTGKNDEESELEGFEAGADDYITKPIKPKLLIARIKSLLRRKLEWSMQSELLSIGDLTIDRVSRTVRLGDAKIALARKEFDLLNLLASYPGKVFPRHEIFNDIWNDDESVGGRTIDVHIRKIRQKIGDQRIKTVKGVGYKLES